MNWFLAPVVLSQTVVLYWIGAPAAMRQLYLGFFARNPEWSGQDGRMARLHRAQKQAIGMVRLAGVAWLLYVGRLLALGADPGDLIPAALASMLCWLALDIAIGAIEQQRIGRSIPLPARRTATFAPRTVGAFIHRAWIVFGLLATAGVCGAYLLAHHEGLVDDERLLARLTVVVLGSAAWCAALWYAVHRKKHAIDVAYGPGHRHFDIHGTVGTLYVFAAAAGFFVVRDLTGLYLLSDALFIALASLILQGFVLVAVRRFRSAASTPLPSPFSVQP